MKKTLIPVILLVLFALNSNKSYAHCEIPCGIYGDSVRVQLLYEHISTIEKSIQQINSLSAEGDKNYNQLVRWVINKEEHATKIQDIVSQYFLHQRIKVKDVSDEDAYAKYTTQLSLLHQMLVYAMKSKQAADLVYIQKLRDTLHSFEHSYFE